MHHNDIVSDANSTHITVHQSLTQASTVNNHHNDSVSNMTTAIAPQQAATQNSVDHIHDIADHNITDTHDMKSSM